MSEKKLTSSIRASMGDMDGSEEIKVEQVENGFIVRVCKEGYKGEGDEKEWYYEEKKYISTSNPLEEEKTISITETIKQALDNLTID